MTNSYFDFDSANLDLIKSYQSLAELISHEYTGEQLKEAYEADRRDNCGEETAKIIYDEFRDEIHELVDIREVSEWAEKDTNHNERVAYMMVNEFLAKKFEDFYEAHQKEIDKNPSKKIAEFIDRVEDRER